MIEVMFLELCVNLVSMWGPNSWRPPWWLSFLSLAITSFNLETLLNMFPHQALQELQFLTTSAFALDDFILYCNNRFLVRVQIFEPF